MGRVAYVFKIKPELKNEYKRIHDEIWPELKKAIRDCGQRNYSLFFRKDGTIFAYLETDDFESGNEKLNNMDISIRWEKMMDKYFVKDDDTALGPEMEILEEVWHLD